MFTTGTHIVFASSNKGRNLINTSMTFCERRPPKKRTFRFGLYRNRPGVAAWVWRFRCSWARTLNIPRFCKMNYVAWSWLAPPVYEIVVWIAIVISTKTPCSSSVTAIQSNVQVHASIPSHPYAEICSNLRSPAPVRYKHTYEINYCTIIPNKYSNFSLKLSKNLLIIWM